MEHESNLSLTSSFADLSMMYIPNLLLFLLCATFLVFLVNPQGMQFCNRSFQRSSGIYDTPNDVKSSLVKIKHLDYRLQQDQMSDLYQQGCYVNSSPLMNGTQQPWAAFMGESKTRETCSSLHSSPSGFLKPSRWNPGKEQLPARKHYKRQLSPYSVLDESGEQDSKKLLVLISSRCLDKKQAENQKTALEILKARRVPFEALDGMKSVHRKRREELYKISGTRAQYPQFFFVSMGGHTTYLGNFKVLLNLHHAEGLPRKYRDAHPHIETWEEVFCDTSQIFSV